jgi:predicted dinucleotide-binding enzyme
MRTVGVLGSGVVGQALSDGFLRHGYEVVRGTRDPKKLSDWKAKAGPKASVATFEDAAKRGEMVVLAVKGTAAEETVRLCAGALAGKPVVDATNPIADAPPVNGVMTLFTARDDSLMERLQRLAPKARFVKAFSCVGSAFMVNPDFGGVRPTMFVCGDDAAAKAEVVRVLDRFGWASEDMGGVTSARAIEPLCVLWCVPGFLRGDWAHAFHWLKPASR